MLQGFRGGGCYGIPCYSGLAITTALTLQAVFRLALRQTEELIGSILHLLGLDLAVPDHSTLGRRAERLELPRLAPRASGAPVHLWVYYTACIICQVPPEAAMRRIWIYLLALLVGLVGIAIIPWISTGFLG